MTDKDNDTGKEVDYVNNPPHYHTGQIECIEAMSLLFPKEEVKAYCKLNAFKYLWRALFKGNPEQDNEKAQWYLEKYLELAGIKKEKFSSSFSDRFAKSLDEGLVDGPDAVPDNLREFAAGIRNPILEAFGIKDSSYIKRKL